MMMISRREVPQYLAIALLLALLTAGSMVVLDRPDLRSTLGSPSLLHWMGTDDLGRGVGTRIMRAAALSLGASAMAWFAAVTIGVVLGGYSAYRPGSWGAAWIRWFIVVFYTTPFFLVVVGVVGALGPGLINAYVVFALVAWAAPARQTAAMVDRLRQTTFVVATQSFGFSPAQVVRYALAPEVARPVIVASLAVLPEILAFDAALAFFGLGAPPPTPTIGRMVLEGINYMSVAWWLILFPVAVLALLCLAVRVIVQGSAR